MHAQTTTILLRIIITKQNSLMASMKLMFRILRRAIGIAITLLKSLIWCLLDNFDYPILIKLADTFLSLYFLIFCDLRPITVDLNDGETTLHFWISGHRKINRPNLLMLHGYGGNSKWQFIPQVTDLSRSFNLFIPDLVFFGRSYSRNTDRSVEFQARSIVGGLKRLGCCGGKDDGGDLSVYSISYGGFVAYRIAKIWPEMIEKLVIVSSGVGFTQQQKMTEMKKHGGDVSEILVPSNPRDLRLLVRVSMNTGLRFLDWVPDFILSQFISVMYETNRQELLDLAKNLLEREEESEFFAISQKTLIVWGDKDQVFPLEHGRRLHRPPSCLLLIDMTLRPTHSRSSQASPRKILSSCEFSGLLLYHSFELKDQSRFELLMESRMEGDVYSGYQMDGKLLQNFQKSFVQVQDILDQNRLLINEINQNHESKQADHLGRNVGLIRELNNNIRTVASLYGDLSHSFARSVDASSEGESTGTLKSDGKANNNNNQKRFRSG